MLEGFPPVIRPKMFDTLASGRGLMSPVWKRALSMAAILKSPKLWKRLFPALVPPVMTQLAVQRFKGTVDAPEVMTVARLAGLPVPPDGVIAVEGPAPVALSGTSKNKYKIGSWMPMERRRVGKNKNGRLMVHPPNA